MHATCTSDPKFCFSSIPQRVRTEVPILRDVWHKSHLGTANICPWCRQTVTLRILVKRKLILAAAAKVLKRAQCDVFSLHVLLYALRRHLIYLAIRIFSLALSFYPHLAVYHEEGRHQYR